MRLQPATAIALVPCITALTVPAWAQIGTLTCSSNTGRYVYCRADTQNQVRLVRQRSGSPCDHGYSWGFDYRGIWVDRGCRADFEYGRRNFDGGGGKSSAIAAGILGAIIVGAVVASSRSDRSDRGDDNHRDYYSDGYRRGQYDWDDNRPPRYRDYNGRFPREYENDFANGYDDGYNNRPRRY